MRLEYALRECSCENQALNENENDIALGILVGRSLLHEGGEREAERRGECELAIHRVAPADGHLLDAPLVRREDRKSVV